MSVELVHHQPDDYNCVHWKGDKAVTNLRAVCYICDQPGYKQAYADRRAQEARESFGVFAAVVGIATILVILTGLIAHHWPGWL